MLIAIAVGLALVYAMLTPLSDGLFDTSMWVAKMLAPTGTDKNENTNQLLKFGQAALMEGWLSNVPFISSIVLTSAIIAAFLYHWWAAIVIFLASTLAAMLTKLVWGRSVSFYLILLHHKMINRLADYRRENDIERAEAAESYCEDLKRIMSLYDGSRLRPPTPKQLRDIPCGDLHYWLNQSASGQS